MMTILAALIIAGARAAYRWYDNRRVPPLDPFWTATDLERGWFCAEDCTHPDDEAHTNHEIGRQS